MAKPTRNKKPVDYSHFGDFEDEDEDFACVKAPPSKKPRVAPKEPERQKKLKTTNKPPGQECGGSLVKPCEERLLVDDRLYQRDLEAALALSMLQTTEENFAVSLPKERDNDVHADSEVAKMDGAPLLSNCSVNINLLGLDKITDDNDTSGRNRQRQAASKAAIQQRKMLLDNEGDGNGDQDEEYEPGTPDVGSESDPDFSEEEEDVEEFIVKKGAKVKENKKEAKIKAQNSKKEKKPLKSRLSATDVDSESDPDFRDEEEDVEEFTVKKGAKVKENKKEAKSKAQSSKKEKKPLKSRLSATVTPAAASPAPATSHPILMKPSNATLAASKPLQVQSPSGARKPKWTPPAQIGRSPNASENLAVKSPSQGLRLGLSRFARVKPLHPGAASD